MTTQIRPGSILRRGADNLSAKELHTLMDNPEEVDSLIADINARRVVFFKAETDAKAALDKLEVASKALAEDQAALAEAVTDLEAREQMVKGGKKALTDFLDWIEANPIEPMEKWPAYTAPPRRSK